MWTNHIIVQRFSSHWRPTRTWITLLETRWSHFCSSWETFPFQRCDIVAAWGFTLCLCVVKLFVQFCAVLLWLSAGMHDHFSLECHSDLSASVVICSNPINVTMPIKRKQQQCNCTVYRPKAQNPLHLVRSIQARIRNLQGALRWSWLRNCRNSHRDRHRRRRRIWKSPGYGRYLLCFLIMMLYV